MRPEFVDSLAHFQRTAFYAKVRRYHMVIFGRLEFVLNLAALKSVLEDSIEFVGAINLMFMVDLSATASDVSLGPLSETSHDLFDSDAWILAVVPFCRGVIQTCFGNGKQKIKCLTLA